MDNWILGGILTILVLFVLLEEQIKNSNLYKQVATWIHADFMRLPPNELAFQVAWDVFLFIGITITTLIISNATGLVNMTTLWILLIGFFLIALITTIRIKVQPEDNRLDRIICILEEVCKQMKDLTDSVNKLQGKLIQEKQDEQKKG